MGNARCEPANGGEAPRKFDLVFNAVDRFGVAQCKQRSNALAVLLNEIERNLDVPSLSILYFVLGHRFAGRKGVQDCPSEHRFAREDLRGLASQHFSAWFA